MAGLIIAAERSGAGKTTVTLGLLAALAQRGTVQAFKVGPDYIDPMFHRYLTGRPSYNLDPILTSESYVRQSFTQHCAGVDAVVIEGVMGLFDGAGSDDTASTAHIARLLELPVLLVVDCSRLSRSLAAIVHGYASFDPHLTLAGVVLNRVGSDRHRQLLTQALAPLEIPILGVLYRDETITIPDRHLGLVPTHELPHLKALSDRLAALGQQSFDWPALKLYLEGRRQKAEGRRQKAEGSFLITSLSPTPSPPLPLSPPLSFSPRIAIAADSAFTFYYPDNLEILESLGAELVPWSPLTDGSLPEAVSGLYFGGGFPEMFAVELAANQSALKQVRAAISAGMPTYAECGGLMYLCECLIDFEGHAWPMVGALPTTVRMEKRLTLGYRQVTALQDSLLVKRGDRLWGHEFHRSDVTVAPTQPLYDLRRWEAEAVHACEGWNLAGLQASYVHLHWGGALWAAQRFVAAAAWWEGLG